MHGARLRWTRFQPPTEDWDHEHCVLCFATFTDGEGEDRLLEGYVFRPSPRPRMIASEEKRTTFRDGHRIVRAPTDDQWVCAACFADFENYFRWTGEKASP